MKKVTWSDITISQLVKINQINQNLEEDEKKLEIISIVLKKPLETVLEQPLGKTVEDIEAISGLENPPKQKLIKGKYTINGRNYKLFTNVNNFTTAQYIDFQMLSKDYRKHLPQFLSIFFIPEEAKHYNENYDIEVVQNDMNDLPCEDGLAVATFFLTWFALSTKAALRSSERAARKMGEMGLMKKLRALRRGIRIFG